MIVGEGDQQLVNKLAGCSNVILTGRVPKENIPEYLAAADIVLVPFPDSIASHSVSPLKLFEALAMNKPIIASAVSGIKEVVSENFNGVLVSARPKEWASAVLELSKDNNINREINNRKIVRSKYDWNYLAEELDRIIDTDISAV
jgi:glycosyltransferase involved in cell wall biosynthesis